LFSHLKGNRGLTLPSDADRTMVGSACIPAKALAFQNEISNPDSDQIVANMAKQIRFRDSGGRQSQFQSFDLDLKSI